MLLRLIEKEYLFVQNNSHCYVGGMISCWKVECDWKEYYYRVVLGSLIFDKGGRVRASPSFMLRRIVVPMISFVCWTLVFWNIVDQSSCSCFRMSFNRFSNGKCAINGSGCCKLISGHTRLTETWVGRFWSLLTTILVEVFPVVDASKFCNKCWRNKKNSFGLAMIGRNVGNDDILCLAKNLRNCTSMYFEGYLWKDQRFPWWMALICFDKRKTYPL